MKGDHTVVMQCNSGFVKCAQCGMALHGNGSNWKIDMCFFKAFRAIGLGFIVAVQILFRIASHIDCKCHLISDFDKCGNFCQTMRNHTETI